MKGVVDRFGRALLSIEVAAEESQPAISMEAWVDTCFTGELVLPASVVEQLSPGNAASVDAVLADPQQVMASTYRCWIDWFHERREVEVIATDGAVPLLGVGLLLGHDVQISNAAMTVAIE